jgi:kexin
MLLIIMQGRNGKGNIYVFAAGNGGQEDSCALDGGVSSMYTIAVGALRYDGYETPYEEECSAKLVSAYTDGIVTSDVVSLEIVTRFHS